MDEREFLDLRIRVLSAFLEKKARQYHAATLRADMEKRRRIHRQCFDLRRAIDKLEDKRRKMGGENHAND